MPTDSNGVKIDEFLCKQILCRFHKSNQKVPPSSPLSNEKQQQKKSLSKPSLGDQRNKSEKKFERKKIILWVWGIKGNFLIQGNDSGATFCLLFWSIHEIWI